MSDKKASGDLHTHLRIKTKKYKKRYKSKDARGRLDGKRHISERPEHIERRPEIGHWEGDTVIGAVKKHCLLTLLEHSSVHTMIHKLSARTKVK